MCYVPASFSGRRFFRDDFGPMIRSRFLWATLFAGLGLIQVGCAVERSSLSMDSNSRFPWLGLQLSPPKSKEPAYHRPIAQKSGKMDEAKVALAVDPPRTETKWSDWLNPLPQRISQPLPRTEPEESASTDTDPIEF
jgi:hypothetical protein